jgi:formylglycine-generating enzyme required for sulfatase activity
MCYSLPTELQWEYACRAGSPGDLGWVSQGKEDSIDKSAWYDGNERDSTQAVRTKQPNAFGFYDMHGNFWEWCQDWCGDYPTQLPADYRGCSSGSSRVLRGGSSGNLRAQCLAALRDRTSPGHRSDSLGIRLASVPEQQAWSA